MTDFKFTVSTDKQPGGWHAAYIPVYERLLAPLKQTQNAVLEIGTDGGGCLLAYQDWFPFARIHGIDINPTPKAIKGQPRIEHWQFDAYTPSAVAAMRSFGPFAVAIDDGPHSLESQLFFVENYPKLLTEDGIAIVEDVQAPEHIAALTEAVRPGCFGFAIDLRQISPTRYDNLLFCVVIRAETGTAS